MPKVMLESSKGYVELDAVKEITITPHGWMLLIEKEPKVEKVGKCNYQESGTII